MLIAPSCPLHSARLDSLDYWTDPALMTTVSPVTAMEWQHQQLVRDLHEQRFLGRQPAAD